MRKRTKTAFPLLWHGVVRGDAGCLLGSIHHVTSPAPVVGALVLVELPHRFQKHGEGSAVDGIKGKRGREECNWNTHQKCHKERGDKEEDHRQTNTTAKVDELFPGERTEDLIFDLNELRNLKSHS